MTNPNLPSTRDLRSLFCERFACPLSEFDERAFKKCLYLHARIIAPVLRWIKSDCFERDLLFAHYFGNAKDWQEATTEIADLCYQDHIQPRFARYALRLRISGQKANELAVILFQPANPIQTLENKPEAVRQAGGIHP
jgi:hypothetical protein